MKKSLIIWYVFLFLLLFMTSCGSRKTNTEKVKEEVKIETSEVVTEKETTETKTDVNVKVDTKTKVDTEKNVVTDITEITPQDNSKPSTIKLPNGQTIDITNAKYRNEKTTDLSKEKTISISKYELLQKQLKEALRIAEKVNRQNIKLLSERKNKQTEKTYSWWNLLWLLLIIPIYYFYRKYLVGRI